MGCQCKQVVALRVEQTLQGHCERGVLSGLERSVLKQGHKSGKMSTVMLPSTRPGVNTFRVVLTDMLPSIKSRVQAMWWVAKAIKDTKRMSWRVIDQWKAMRG